MHECLPKAANGLSRMSIKSAATHMEPFGKEGFAHRPFHKIIPEDFLVQFCQWKGRGFSCQEGPYATLQIQSGNSMLLCKLNLLQCARAMDGVNPGTPIWIRSLKHRKAGSRSDKNQNPCLSNLCKKLVINQVSIMFTPGAAIQSTWFSPVPTDNGKLDSAWCKSVAE